MGSVHEVLLVGRDAMRATTALLQRARLAHPTYGLYQAAELEWWWTVPRSTDTMPQLFWFDADDRPVAAVTATDFSDGSSAVTSATTLVAALLPDASVGRIAEVVGRGLEHVAAAGVGATDIEVRRDDDVMPEVLAGHGFTRSDDGLIVCWLDVGERPTVSSLADGYRLWSRSGTLGHAHHMTTERRPNVDERLAQTTLYRRGLDLVVLDPDGEPAAYGLFWYDPVTRTGVVEPMRTFDAHQRRGLGRHILTAGLDLLARAGATRVSIGFEPENPASGPLYRSVGFQPTFRTDVWSR